MVAQLGMLTLFYGVDSIRKGAALFSRQLGEGQNKQQEQAAGTSSRNKQQEKGKGKLLPLLRREEFPGWSKLTSAQQHRFYAKRQKNPPKTEGGKLVLLKDFGKKKCTPKRFTVSWYLNLHKKTFR